MKHKKRYLSSLFLALFAVFLAAAAGGGKENAPGEKNVEYVRLSLFCDVEFWKPPQWDTGEGTITGEISERTGVIVDTNVPARDADKQLSLLLVNGELPDMVSVTDPVVVSQLVDSGKVWDLEEFFREYLPESHILKDFPEDVKASLVKRDGGFYAWPSHIDSDDARKRWPPSAKCYADEKDYLWNIGIIWNRDLLEELDLSVEKLKTKEQVMAAFARAKDWNREQQGKKIIPLLVDGEDYQAFTLGFLQETFGMLPVGEDGSYVSPVLLPETKEALQFLNQALREGYVEPKQLTWQNLKIKDILADGQALCFIGNIANTNIDAREWVSSGQIRSESGKLPVWGKRGTATTGWLNTFLSKSCAHPKELAVWLDFMTSEEGLELWDCGIEDFDFVRDDAGRIRRLEPEENPQKNEISVWWPFGNMAWLYSVLAPYGAGSQDEAESQLKVAYAKAEGTRIYNDTLLDNTLSGDAKKLEERLNSDIHEEFSRLILENSEQGFEQRYEALIQYLKDNHIEELDREKNRMYQQACREAGETICQ